MQRYFSQNKLLWNFLARISFGAFETRCPVDSLLNKLAALSLSLSLSLSQSLSRNHTHCLSLTLHLHCKIKKPGEIYWQLFSRFSQQVNPNLIRFDKLKRKEIVADERNVLQQKCDKSWKTAFFESNTCPHLAKACLIIKNKAGLCFGAKPRPDMSFRFPTKHESQEIKRGKKTLLRILFFCKISFHLEISFLKNHKEMHLKCKIRCFEKKCKFMTAHKKK